jgi:hypothetical protein
MIFVDLLVAIIRFSIKHTCNFYKFFSRTWPFLIKRFWRRKEYGAMCYVIFMGVFVLYILCSNLFYVGPMMYKAYLYEPVNFGLKALIAFFKRWF